jgi:hypothetical protein
MKVVIKPWLELDEALKRELIERTKAPEHGNDPVRNAWETEAAHVTLYVPVVHEGHESFPLGIFGAGGSPKNIIPSWWIDSRYRGRGYTRRAIEKFGDYLLTHRDVTGVGRISIQTGPHDDHHQKSGALARLFRSRFRRIAIDSNCLTYVIQAMNSGGRPEGDSGDLDQQKVALVRIYLYLDDTLWVPKTAMDEARRIKVAGRADEHASFNSSLFGTWPTQNLARVDARAAELLPFHNKQRDCFVMAEAEDTFMTVLLTCDRDMIKRLRNQTNLLLSTPLDYWASLSMFKDARPKKLPHATNPLAQQTWWRWDLES